MPNKSKTKLRILPSSILYLLHQTQTYRERVQEDPEEEEDEEEDDEEDDEPLEAPPQDELEGLIGGGEPQEGGLWTPGRTEEDEKPPFVCSSVGVTTCARLTEAPPGGGSCWVRLCRCQLVFPRARAPSRSPETSPPSPETETMDLYGPVSHGDQRGQLKIKWLHLKDAFVISSPVPKLSTNPSEHESLWVCLCLGVFVLLTAMIFSPFCSQVQGHHPLTVFCSNRDTSLSAGWSRSCRVHFSGDLAGRSMWFRSITR